MGLRGGTSCSNRSCKLEGRGLTSRLGEGENEREVMKRLSDPNSRGRASSWTVSDTERRVDSSRTSLVLRGRGNVEKEEKKEIAKVGHFCDPSNRIDRLLRERLPEKDQRISERCCCMIEKETRRKKRKELHNKISDTSDSL